MLPWKRCLQKQAWQMAGGWNNILEASSEYATGRYPEIHPHHRDHFFLSCASCILGIARAQKGIFMHSWCHLNPRRPRGADGAF